MSIRRCPDGLSSWGLCVSVLSYSCQFPHSHPKSTEPLFCSSLHRTPLGTFWAGPNTISSECIDILSQNLWYLHQTNILLKPNTIIPIPTFISLLALVYLSFSFTFFTYYNNHGYKCLAIWIIDFEQITILKSFEISSFVFKFYIYSYIRKGELWLDHIKFINSITPMID